MNETAVNTNDATLFQKHCETIIGKLTEDCVEAFRATKGEESRIKLLYEKAAQLPITISENNGKNLAAAQEEKTVGNSYFAKKDYENALKAYNTGIVKCPQDTASARELLTILISNRSATYFELKEYKRVFNDIDYLTEIGNYPPHLQYKIWLRKAKCYDALQNERLYTEAYNEVLESLKHSKLDEATIETKIKEIENSRQTKVVSPVKHEMALSLRPEIFVGGKEYIAAHPKIRFEVDAVQGRFARAAEDIQTGTVIVEENPHCAVVDFRHALTNCQYCMLSVDQPIACPSCGNVVFCGSNCERLANKSFHKVECSVQQSLFNFGASINCSMAMRIISQRSFAFFNDKKKFLKDYLKDNCKKSVIKKKVYRFDDYENVFFLCRNESLRKKEELIHYTCMAIYLLRLLKKGGYFPSKTSDETLTEDELYIGALTLRHLELLQFNAHEISELKNTPISTMVGGYQSNYENATIGAGVYPTLALFNHSCDPSIVRYNIKNKMVVRTVKPVKAGDIIYENYGPLYTAMPTEKRRETLQKNYWFECLCTPCVDLWPMFDEMNEYELRIPCQDKRCPFVFVVKGDENPLMTCNYCQTVTALFSHLKGLVALEDILPIAEAQYGMGQLENAMKKFIEGLEVLFKYLKPPVADIVKIQQRIRVCMVHMGNRECGYKVKL